jgi:hypothetical protein
LRAFDLVFFLLAFPSRVFCAAILFFVCFVAYIEVFDWFFQAWGFRLSAVMLLRGTDYI